MVPIYIVTLFAYDMLRMRQQSALGINEEFGLFPPHHANSSIHPR